MEVSSVLLMLLTTLVLKVLGKIGFIKDQSMDMVFPPKRIQGFGDLPAGYLRPLGWQRNPDGPVKSEAEMPNAREFYNDYVKLTKPVVFRNAVVNSSAQSLWVNDDYLQNKYGKVSVIVTVRVGRRENDLVLDEQVVRFKKFLYEYMYEEWYLTCTVPQELLEELPWPKCLRCGTISQYLQEPILWMSSGKTPSRLHSHEDHSLHCVLFGRRDFILIEGRFRDNFPFKWDFEGSMSGYSELNMEMINNLKYKKILMTPWIWSTLKPGDCIFVPAGYLYQVKSYARSLSVSVLFATMPDFDDDGCKLEEEEFEPLSAANFTWTFSDSKRQLSDKQPNAQSLRHLLRVQMGAKLILSRAKFVHFYEKAMQFGSEERPSGTKVFDMLVQSGKSELTLEDLTNLDDPVLEKVADIFTSQDQKRKKHLPLHEEL